MEINTEEFSKTLAENVKIKNVSASDYLLLTLDTSILSIETCGQILNALSQRIPNLIVPVLSGMNVESFTEKEYMIKALEKVIKELKK